MGDFNAVLYQVDRQGGTQVHDFETRPFAECMEQCQLQELKYQGPYYTWTNGTIRTRIDRAFINVLWYDQFDYCHVNYLPRVLSDHSPMLLEFLGSPRPPPQFQFCDMWTRHHDFLPIVTRCLHQARGRLDLFLNALSMVSVSSTVIIIRTSGSNIT